MHVRHVSTAKDLGILVLAYGYGQCSGLRFNGCVQDELIVRHTPLLSYGVLLKMVLNSKPTRQPYSTGLAEAGQGHWVLLRFRVACG